MSATLEYLRSLPPEELLARTLQGEGGTGLAEGAVIANRLKSGRWGDTWADVLLTPGQFSLFNAVTGYAGGEGANDLWRREPSAEKLAIARQIIAGDYTDPTSGALNYYNPDKSSPEWGGDDWLRIGPHVFGTAGQGGAPPMRRVVDDTPRPRPEQPARPSPERMMRAAAQERTAGALSAMRGGEPPSPWERISGALSQPRESMGGNSLLSALGIAAHGLDAYARGAMGRPGYTPAYSAQLGQRLRGENPGRERMNQTLQWLQRMGRTDLAEAVAAGALPPKDAVTMVYDQMGDMSGTPELKEAEAKAAVYYARANASNRIIRDLEKQGTDFWQNIAEGVPLVGNYMLSDEYQRFEQARRDFVNAILRRESGAVISDQEFANAERQYFPRPGDSDAVIRQKRKNREQALRGIRMGAGPANLEPLYEGGEGPPGGGSTEQAAPPTFNPDLVTGG